MNKDCPILVFSSCDIVAWLSAFPNNVLSQLLWKGSAFCLFPPLCDSKNEILPSAFDTNVV